MAQRGRDKLGLDDFPTPPWATRALFEHVIDLYADDQYALEPCCNRGYMAEVLGEYFIGVAAGDIKDYGYIRQHWTGDFLTETFPGGYDWGVTNPPFKQAQQIAEKMILEARRGVAVLCRLSFLETIKRYDFFKAKPPTVVAAFAERVPMVEGRYDPKASTATAYAWFVWDKRRESQAFGESYGKAAVQFPFALIPPCRSTLDRADDEFLNVP